MILAPLDEIPGCKAPAARSHSIAAGVFVGCHGQKIYLWPLDVQPAVVHKAASVARVGIPAPAHQQLACLLALLGTV